MTDYLRDIDWLDDVDWFGDDIGWAGDGPEPEDERGPGPAGAADGDEAPTPPRRPDPQARLTPEIRQIPSPHAGGAPARRGRQVNCRLSDREYADLCRAAGIVGVAPSRLAMMFIRNGAERFLTEQRWARR